MLENWTYTAADQKLSKELQKFILERVFDIHAHLYCERLEYFTQ